MQGVGPIRTRSARATRPGPKKPKTAEELDRELDSFMKDDTKVDGDKASANGSAAVLTNLSAAPAPMITDVEMS
jgi:THO complex subunit 4